MKLKKIFLDLAFLLLVSAFSFAEYNSYGIPDSTEIRKSIINSWFTQNISELRNKNSEIRKNNLGETFQIRMEEKVSSYAIIVAPESYLNVDLISEKNTQTVQMAVYPEGAAGSFVLFRDKASGKSQKIQWYFNPDADVYLEFYENLNKTYADVIVCTSYLARSVPIPVKFNQIFSSSFENVLTWTKNSINWKNLKVISGQYQESLQMIQVIRENLPKMDYAQNACYNENGELYSILTGKKFTLTDENGKEYYPEENGRLTLSGAGFIKWIIDGLVSQYTGQGTNIQEILVPTVEYSATSKNGVLSQEYNLSFALDWCRNLAAKAQSVRLSKNYDFKTGGLDVNQNFFAAENQNGNLVSSAGYLKDTGYSIRKLKSLLYVLAIREPSYFYLAAIKTPSSIKHDEMVFNNCAAIFPYFDDAGHFDCAVFTMNSEISLSDFISTKETSYVHLERVKASNYFKPKS